MHESPSQRAAIEVVGLTKTFRVPVRDGGLGSSMRALIKREHRLVEAVREVSFTIAPGEVVGFLGPNGAGKTTTLKMLAGLVHPSAGSVDVLGFEPRHRPKDLLRRIALVMGNRQQLNWDLPAADGFELLRAIYGIDRARHVEIRDELVELFDLGDLIRKPMRNLSLGERMRCELTASLLHRPDVLFLDEPTLGLDLGSQRKVREFLAEYNRRHGATILLTSHYMADIEALCERVVVINHGSLLYDGGLGHLVERTGGRRVVTFQLDGADGESTYLDDIDHVELVERGEGRLVLSVPRDETAAVIGAVLARVSVLDVTIDEPSIEGVIEQVFEHGVSDEAAVPTHA